MTSQTINLNLIPGSIEPVINVSQYDKGQTWNFNIYSGSQPFTIPTGSSITIQGTKPDKTGFQYGCTFSGNVVTAIEQQQMTILSGKVPAEIVITKDDELIGSLNFNIMVEKAALADDTAISETDLPLIEEAVEALSHIDETLETMKGYKEDSEAYANGKRNGSDVGSSDPAYHNNSKYYAGQASSSASSASGSATSAGTNALISEGYAVGKQNGSAVGSGSPYYQNNAEYYKGQAANSATNAGNSATAASGSATTASNKALVAEGYADGKQNGTDVASGSPYYHNNSKYYSEQAAASAQSAAQSAASFTVDSTLSTSSTNPVQNKVITTDLNNVKQASSNEVSARATLGAHNWLNLDASLFRGREGATYTFLSTGIEITNTESGSFRVCSWWIKNLKQNTDYILSSDVNKISGTGRIFVRDSDSGTFLCDTGNISTSKNVSLSFNTGTYTNLYIALYSTTETAAIGDVKYENLLLRLATDSDTTFRPYVPTNSQLLSYKDNGVLGAKNLLPFDLAYIKSINTTGEWISANAYKMSDVTFTVNSDGSVTLSRETAGNDRAIFNFTLRTAQTFKLSKGEYKLYYIVDKSYTGNLYERVLNNSGTELLSNEVGVERNFSISDSDSYLTVQIVASNSFVGNNVTIYPMIRLATDTDPTFQPYAMTNKQLTDVAEQVTSGYVLKSYSSVTVTADGTKTNKTLLNELYAAISQLFTNNPNSYIKILTLRAGNTYYPIYVVPQLRTTVPSNWLFQGFTFGGTNYISSFSVESSNSSALRFALDTGTKEDISTDIPSSGTTFIAQYEIYKQIS